MPGFAGSSLFAGGLKNIHSLAHPSFLWDRIGPSSVLSVVILNNISDKCWKKIRKETTFSGIPSKAKLSIHLTRCI
jgi:hypothetical protein